MNCRLFRVLRSAVLLAMLAPASLTSAAHAAEPRELVLALPGTLPILLTVPHDGDQRPGVATQRKKGEMVRDLHTARLAQETARRIEERLGARPGVVIARFARRYADANRDAREAAESPDGLAAWRAYHDQIEAMIKDMKVRFPAGALLVDLHGQGQVPDTLFIGTRNGRTLRPLFQAHGREMLYGETGFAGEFARRGYKVIPSGNDARQHEDRRFDGGHTVFTYGSHQPGGVHAIQLEFGLKLREDNMLPADLADALIDFLRHYGLLN